ncbi:MAG: oligosaccharide flippase family protein, partial [Lachnospiraceae bacterium]|nr:oligosaccharide flippase family protein [Lachnospiraceae bacterium]
SDLSNTIISLASAIAVMGMYDAMYRMFFEKEEKGYKKDICSTTITYTLGASIVVSILMVIFKRPIAQLFYGNRQYENLVYICAVTTLVSATNCIISAPTRMQNQRKIFLITNTVSPILSYSISIPLILQGHYLIALPLAYAISGATMELVFYILNHSWFEFNRFNKGFLKQLLAIAIPLMPNFLIYWVFNSSDRVMISNLLNVGEAGIYSVGSKLGLASQLIYTAFAGGWQYFAFKTMKEDDQVESNSRIFEYLGIVSFAATTFICAWSYGIYKLLFTGDYVRGYIISPYLFLAPLLQMLFQVIANQFLVVKKTWPNMFILGSGAIVNIILNFVMIPRVGIEGASIATLIGYVVSDVICCIVLLKMKLMVISKRFIYCSILMTVYFILWRQLIPNRVGIGTVCAAITSGMFCLLYKNDIKQLCHAIKK